CEITGAVKSRRNRDSSVVDHVELAVLLAVVKEEGFVLPVIDLGNANRPAEVETVVVAAGPRQGVGERRGRVERFVHDVVVAAAVVLVGAGSRGDVEQAPTSTTAAATT